MLHKELVKSHKHNHNTTNASLIHDETKCQFFPAFYLFGYRTEIQWQSLHRNKKYNKER